MILMGMVGTSISLFMFGLSKSLPWAMVTRSMCGLLSGNIGVIKSSMAEMTDASNRGNRCVCTANPLAKGFSLLPMAGGIGAIIGPVIGGFLANPVTKYPALFGDGWVRSTLAEYPYLLPCALCSSIIAVAAITGYMHLEETYQNEVHALPPESPKDRQEEGIFTLPLKAWVAVFCFGGMSFQSVVQSELVPLWLATPTRLGGLGFSSNDIGSLMSFSGFALLAIQLTLYNPVHRRLGTLLIYRNAFLLYALNVLVYPNVARLTGPYDGLLWPALLVLTAIRTGINVFIRTSANLMVSRLLSTNRRSWWRRAPTTACWARSTASPRRLGR